MNIQTSYSPTVITAFEQKPDWFVANNGYNEFDKDGYNAFGYHKDTLKDRAGYSTQDYVNSLEYFENYGYDSILYHDVKKHWNLDANNEISYSSLKKAA